MQETDLTPADYFNIINRRKWAVVLPASIIFVLALAVAFLLPPSYRSTATILIEEQEIPQDFVLSTITTYAEQRLQTIHQRIMSSTKLMEIIKKEQLYTDLLAKKTTEEVIERMRDEINLRQISAEVVDRRSGRPTTATIAFTLAYESQTSPSKVQKVSNILTSLFLEENIKERKRQAKGATVFLDDELQKIRQRLDENEREIAAFKEKNVNNLPELTQITLQSMLSADTSIDRLLEQLRSLKEQKGELQEQLANLSPDLLKEDKARLEGLRLELNHLQSRFTDEYPDVIKTKKEIGRLEASLAAKRPEVSTELPDNPAYITLSSRLAGVKADIDSTNRQLTENRKRKEELQQRLDATPKVEEEYNALLTKRRNLQLQYDELTQKLMEANVAYGLEEKQQGARFTLIDPARLPERPSKPNRLAIGLIGLVLGMGAGVACAALLEFADQSVRHAHVLQAKTSIPVLTTIPQIVTAADRQRRKNRTILATIITLLVLVAAIYAFHTWVMDLNVFWAKVMRKMQ